MSLALYEIADQYLHDAKALADLDLPDDVIRDTLEGMKGEIEIKGANVAMFVRNLEASADAIKDAETRMAARRKAIEARAERIREYLKAQMERCEISAIDSPYVTLKIKKNPPKVIIDNEESIPSCCKTTKTVETIDRAKVKAEIEAGHPIAAHIEQGTRLEIK